MVVYKLVFSLSAVFFFSPLKEFVKLEPGRGNITSRWWFKKLAVHVCLCWSGSTFYNLLPFELFWFNIPSELCTFGNDRDLQGNKLTGQIPDEIGNCADLTHLYELSGLVSFITYLHFVLVSVEVFPYDISADNITYFMKLKGFVW